MDFIRLFWNFLRLRANLKKNPEKIRRIQEKRLRQLLRYAYNNSPYYRASFEAAGLSYDRLAGCPVKSLPTINKQILMDNFDEIVTRSDLNQEQIRRFDANSQSNETLFAGKYHVVHSSGSTGKPGYFVYDVPAWNEMLAGIVRGGLWNYSIFDIFKTLANDPRVLFIAATDGRYGGAMAVSAGITGMNAHQLSLDIKTPLSQWVEKINEFKPTMVIGYPSAIKILGDLVETKAITIKVDRVVSCGEPLDGGLRKYIEGLFDCEVINFYGASESLVLGLEDGRDDCMHLFDDMNYIEIENDKMYLTSLYNYAQPIIRYEISDQLILKESQREASPFTQAKIVIGRQEDLLWFNDESGKRDFLHPLAIEGFCIEGLVDYQFCQTGNDSFEMRAEVSSPDKNQQVRDEMLSQMGAILDEKNLDYVDFSVRFDLKIVPDSRTGKKKMILEGRFDPDEESDSKSSGCM